MAGRKRKRTGKSKSEDTLECYNCDKPVKSTALRCPHCGKLFSAGRQVIAVITVAIILSAAGTWYLLLPGESGFQPTDGTPDLPADEEVVFIHDIGPGENDFWDRTVSHPSWVVTAVQTTPQLILTHSTGCAPCDAMLAICGPLSIEYSGRITYYDITSGVDEPEASDCFDAYDPTDPNYVPLTTIVTMGPSNNIIWHSWEGVVDEYVLRGWIEDAILYLEEYG